MEVNNISANTTSTAPNDAVEPQVFIDEFLTSGQLICALLGIPLNLIIIVIIVTWRHLRRKPRNIIWAGISSSNIFVLLTNLLDLIGFYHAIEAAALCRLRFFLIGFPATTFLMNNFFSLIDRYLSIFHSVWYRRCVTARLVFGIQLAAFILLFLLMKPHYIFGFVQVKCNVVHPFDRLMYFLFITLFLILCLSGQLTVFIMIKKHLVIPSTNEKQNSTNGGNDTTNNSIVEAARARNVAEPNGHNGALSDLTVDNEEIVIAPEEAVRALGQPVMEPDNAIKKSLHFVRIRDQMVSRLELEATRNVIFCVGIMLLFSLPWIISCVFSLICNARVINQALSEEETSKSLVEQCSSYYWANSYTRFVSLIGHSVYQFFVFVSRSKVLCAALGRAHRRRLNGNPVDKTAAGKIGNHPQRMKKLHHRPRYNRQPHARLRFEIPERNGVHAINCQP